MTVSWTRSFREPLASSIDGGLWDRVEEARRGGWLLLAREGENEGTSWYHLQEDGGEMEPISVLEDPRLPQVPRLTGRWLRLGCRVRLLTHRVGRRATFLIEERGSRRIEKVYRRSTGLLPRWTLLSSDRYQRWSVPEVLAVDERINVLTLDYRRGTSFNHRWFAGEATPADGDRIADLLRWIARTPVPDTLPVHGKDDEAKILSERLAAFERVVQDPPKRMRELGERVTSALLDDPASRPVFSHRDFHDKQVLLDGDRGTLIDLDLAAAAPPALDIANIIAHMRLRSLRGAALPWQEMAGRLVDARRVDLGADSLHRWTAGTLMRLSLIYALRRRGPSLIDELLNSTRAALERSGEWRGIL